MVNPTRYTLSALAAAIVSSAVLLVGSADSTLATGLLRPRVQPAVNVADESPPCDLGPAALLLSPGALAVAPALGGFDGTLHGVEQPEPVDGGTGTTVPWLLAGAIVAAFITFVVIAATPSTGQ